MALRQVLREAWRRRPTLAKITPKAYLKQPDEWSFLHEPDKARPLLDAERSAAEAFFASSEAFRARLRAEEASLVPEEPMVPEEQGPYMYFQRPNAEGFLEFGRYVQGEPHSEEILLNTETLARESGYADVASCKVCDDHEVLAYVVDTVGDDSFELGIRRLCAGEDIRIPGIRSVEFLNTDAGVISLLAVQTDSVTKRANQVLEIAIHGSEVQQNLLWEERNEAAYLELFKTKDRKFVLASSNTKSTSEVRVARCGQPSALKCLLKPVEGVEYFAEHHENRFIVVSNHERKDFAVYTLAEDLSETWQDLRPFFQPPGEMHVTDADLLSRWLVLYGHEAASPRICVVPMQGEAYLVELPEIGTVEPGVNAEGRGEAIRFTLRSPVEPGCIYNLHLGSGVKEILAQASWDDSLKQSIQCDRLEVPARDGRLIPLTLLRQGTECGPCLLHVYGGYGSCLSADFRTSHLSLLQRGWSVAFAHVRGGGERGWAWHQAGKKLEKSRSILDLSDCIRFLLARGIAAPGALCLKGSSAGGFALGALLNSRDEAALVGAAILEVPFLDVLTGMSDPLLPLTTHEREEWGDPEDSVHEMNLRSLSPYENLGTHRYPPIYLSCALADARVPSWMSTKYAARLRARTPGFVTSGARRRVDASRSCVLQVAAAGHAGAMDWLGRAEESARQVAFLHQALGLELR